LHLIRIITQHLNEPRKNSESDSNDSEFGDYWGGDGDGDDTIFMVKNHAEEDALIHRPYCFISGDDDEQ
jgi:hypothetical protein